MINGRGSDLNESYTLRQVNGASIPGHYNGDSLKNFLLRGGYLITGEEESLPAFQNIRLDRASFKLSSRFRNAE